MWKGLSNKAAHVPPVIIGHHGKRRQRRKAVRWKSLISAPRTAPLGRRSLFTLGQSQGWTGINNSQERQGPVACVKSCVWHSSDMPPQGAKGPREHDMAFPLREMCQQLIPRPFQGELCSKQVAWIHLAGYLFTSRYTTLLKAYCRRSGVHYRVVRNTLAKVWINTLPMHSHWGVLCNMFVSSVLGSSLTSIAATSLAAIACKLKVKQAHFGKCAQAHLYSTATCNTPFTIPLKDLLNSLDTWCVAIWGGFNVKNLRKKETCLPIPTLKSWLA